ncbi:hypothetical protein ES319_A03G142700v1 [Gossypium barbadense]|uniref:SGNH hydrolase-type esterase domain-containing protein n=2 Tax=Gossypium TaxID=3633 RepID=A0A2P5W0Q9_GOSBA|nr:hypothetical protein ES319_A03G142700v1 [Gossypium barbadense]PPR84661.1 hypothetical protein GOBAR_AA36049 [Gossypium barbadense]TYH25340.1 hypothetical protein ES288_A03G160500v1 [Gossypium darwinii]
MTISKYSFHVLFLILLVSFSFSYAHFRHITPKEIDPKSFNSHSSPLSPSLTSKGSGLLSGSSSSKDSSLFDNLSSSNASGSSKISDSSSVSTNSKGFAFSGSFRGSGLLSASTNSGASNNKEFNINLKANLSGCFSKVFAFGDSYTDTGNARLIGILKSFVGAVLTGRVSQGGNSNFKLGGRSSNGRMVVDFLCDSLNIPTPIPYKAISSDFDFDSNSGVNFAVGGATSLSGDFFVNHKIGHTLMWKGIPLGFQTQIEWFNHFVTRIACKRKTEEECKAEMGKHLIWLGQMGVDDFARVIGSSVSMRWLTDITINHISKILTTLLDSGGKFVVVQGLPPVGCCPLSKLLTPQSEKDEMGCSLVINRAVMAHNELLQKTLEDFRVRHGTEVTISYADYFNAYKAIMGNLAGFGFSDGSEACCGVGGGLLNFNLHNLCGMAGTTACEKPSNHVHWDGLHLTEAMHKQITRLFLHGGYCKPSFDDIISRQRNSGT